MQSNFTRLLLVVLSTAAFLDALPIRAADNWTQFRGPNASGIAADETGLPSEIGPGSKHLVWKTPLAKGHSSPVIFGNRIFLTACEGKRLLTLGLDRDTGKVVWEAKAPYKKLESIHRIGSRATSSVATDGKSVVSFFGSSGLFCYDTDGKELWQRRLGPFNNQFGATSSPVLVGNRIVMVQDHDTGSHLATYDLKNGDEIWRIERPNFRRNYGTPTIWYVDGRPQIVISGTAHVMGYDLETGTLLWTVRGVSRVVNTTPVVGDDGMLYVSATGGSQTKQPSFAELLKNSDANENGLLEPKELPKSPIKSFFGQFDRDRSGTLDKKEYESIREIFSMSRTVALSIKPGGKGDITESHVRWTQAKSIPRNPSPLYYQGVVYLVNNGGIVTALDAKTGKILKQGRVSGTGKYYSSPIIGDGKMYMLNERGQLSVITTEPNWKQLASANFEEDVYACPSIAAGRVYIRTVGHLYCFRQSGN